jgi:IS30 family transposase
MCSASSTWDEWLDNTTGGASQRKIAQRIHRSPSTVSRWLRAGVPPEAAIQIAIGYHADLYEALIAAGWLKPSDIEKIDTTSRLTKQATTKLTAELHRRAINAEKRKSDC